MRALILMDFERKWLANPLLSMDLRIGFRGNFQATNHVWRVNPWFPVKIFLKPTHFSMDFNISFYHLLAVCRFEVETQGQYQRFGLFHVHQFSARPGLEWSFTWKWVRK